MDARKGSTAVEAPMSLAEELMFTMSRRDRRLVRSLRQRVDQVKATMQQRFDALEATRNCAPTGAETAVCIDVSNPVTTTSSSREPVTYGTSAANIAEFIRYLRSELDRKANELEESMERVSAFEVFRVLTHSSILHLKDEFRRHHKMMTPSIFISLIMSALAASGYTPPTQQHSVELEEELRRLFEVMDFDDSGDVDWDEFTSYMLFAQREILRRTPEEALQPIGERVASLRMSVSRKIRQFPAVDAIIAIAEWLPDAVVLTEFDCVTRNILGKHPLPPKTTAVTYVQPLRKYVFVQYDESLSVATSRVERNKYVLDVTDHRSGTMNALELVYHSSAQMLVGGGSNGAVTCLPLRSLDDGTLIPHVRVQLHNEAICCMLALPCAGSKVAVAALFGGTKIIDCRTGVTLLHLVDRQTPNPTGVIKSMAYIPVINALLTVGSSTPRLWMTASGCCLEPCIGILTDDSAPHKRDVVAIWIDWALLPHTVTTVDDSGFAKRWDLRSFSCVANHRLLPYADSACEIPMYRILAATPSAPSASSGILCYALGVQDHRCELRQFHLESRSKLRLASERLANDSRILTCAAFNHHLDLVYSVYGGDLIAHDLSTGKIVFYNDRIADRGTVTAMVVDPVGRRVFVGSSEGDIVAFNTSTGAVLKRFEPLPSEVAFLYSTEEALFAGCKNGAVSCFTLSKTAPYAVVSLSDSTALTCIGVHVQENMAAIGDSSGTIHFAEIKHQRRLAPLVQYSLPDPSAGVAADVRTNRAVPPSLSSSAAEVNFATDRMVIDYTVPRRGEVTCCVSLAPYPGFVVSDTTGQLSLFAGRSSDPIAAYCGTWDSFTAKAELPGASQAVTTCGYFMQETQELFTGDDHGCFVTWAMKAPLIDRGMLCVDMTRVRPNTVSDVFPAARQCVVINAWNAIVSMHWVAERSFFVLATTTGRIAVATANGGVLGMLYPDRKFETSAPLNYFVSSESSAEFDRKHGAQRKCTRSKLLWSKLRGRVLGQGANFAAAINAAVLTTRSNQPKLLSRTWSDVQEKADDVGDRHTEEDDGADFVTQQPTEHPSTPPCSPRPPLAPRTALAKPYVKRSGVHRRIPKPRVGVPLTPFAPLLSSSDEEEGDISSHLPHARAPPLRLVNHSAPPPSPEYRSSTREVIREASSMLEKLRVKETPEVSAETFDTRPEEDASFELRRQCSRKLFPPNTVVALSQPMASSVVLTVDPGAPLWIQRAVADFEPTTTTVVVAASLHTDGAALFGRSPHRSETSRPSDRRISSPPPMSASEAPSRTSPEQELANRHAAGMDRDVAPEPALAHLAKRVVAATQGNIEAYFSGSPRPSPAPKAATAPSAITTSATTDADTRIAFSCVPDPDKINPDLSCMLRLSSQTPTPKKAYSFEHPSLRTLESRLHDPVSGVHLEIGAPPSQLFAAALLKQLPENRLTSAGADTSSTPASPLPRPMSRGSTGTGRLRSTLSTRRAHTDIPLRTQTQQAVVDPAFGKLHGKVGRAQGRDPGDGRIDLRQPRQRPSTASAVYRAPTAQDSLFKINSQSIVLGGTSPRDAPIPIVVFHQRRLNNAGAAQRDSTHHRPTLWCRSSPRSAQAKPSAPPPPPDSHVHTPERLIPPTPVKRFFARRPPQQRTSRFVGSSSLAAAADEPLDFTVLPSKPKGYVP